MFRPGSRYRNLPEITPVNAKGERLRGQTLRIIPPTPGSFLHTVHTGDRLDLLAYKYYGDSTKWWQVADANPQSLFPVALLEDGPVVEEIFTLVHPDFSLRFEALRVALAAFGAVKQIGKSLFLAGQAATLGALQSDLLLTAGDPDFLESALTAVFDPDLLGTTRQQLMATLAGQGFHFLRAFPWSLAGTDAETYFFDDEVVKMDWRSLLAQLAAMPGVLQVQSSVAETALYIAYNQAMITRETILSRMQHAQGFAVQPDSVALSRTGAQIVIPPNEMP